MDLYEQLDHLDGMLLGQIRTDFPDELSDAEKATINAYVVLAHAVLEEYLESLYVAYFDHAIEQLERGIFSVAHVCLAYSIRDWGSKSSSYTKRVIPRLIAAERDQLKSQVKNNHGLAQKYVEKLSELVGLNWKELEDNLAAELADLNTLSKSRGEAGHLSPFTSAAVFITRQVYPDDVRKWVENARDAVLLLEQHMNGVLQVELEPKAS